MFKLQKYLALLFSLIIIAISFVVFEINLTTLSVQDGFSQYSTEKISDTLKIFKNLYGIPHIVAHNVTDAYFGMGFAHAQDRLWQMDYQRRAASGRLAEIFGDTAVSADRLMRAINISKIAARIWQNMDNNTKSLLEAYSKGVNYYIEKNKNKLQFEFDALSYKPEKWEPIDCIKIQRLFAFEQSLSFKSDIIFADIAERIGIERASGLLPSYSKGAIVIFGDSSENATIKSNRNDSIAPSAPDSLQISSNELQQSYKIIRGFYEFLTESNTFLKLLPAYYGGDVWTVRSQKNYKSPAILANEFQLPLSIPTRFYQMHTTCNDFNVTGLTIPGMPIFLTGRNDYLAWGISDAAVDDFDFFIEKINQKDTNCYISSNGSKVKFKINSDTLKIRKKEVPFYARSTTRSYLLSDLYKPDESDQSNLPLDYSIMYSKYCLTFSWAGNEISDEFKSYYQMACSRNVAQFKFAVSKLGSPTSIIAYADVNNNMGLISVGFLPKRQQHCRANFPNPGWIPSFTWSGVQSIAQSDISTISNKTYLFAADNLISHSSSTFISNLFEPQLRTELIDSMLNKPDKYSIRDAQIMQNDYLSAEAQDILKIIIPALRQNLYHFSSIESGSLTLLEDWDYIMNPDSPAATVYFELMRQIIRFTFVDELGDQLTNEYLSLPDIAYGKIFELLKDQNSIWFDDLSTQAKENSEDIIFRAFHNATVNLKKIFGTDEVSEWKFGKIHSVNLNHFLSINGYLCKALNIGPFPAGGDNTTINRMESSLNDGFEVIGAASMRFITDLSENYVQTVIAGGASGEPMGRNYGDQVQLWLNGGYIQLSTNAKPDDKFKLKVIFKPGNKSILFQEISEKH